MGPLQVHFQSLQVLQSEPRRAGEVRKVVSGLLECQVLMLLSA